MSGENSIKVAQSNIDITKLVQTDSISSNNNSTGTNFLLFNTELSEEQLYPANTKNNATANSNVKDPLFKNEIKKESQKTSLQKSEDLNISVRTGALSKISNYFNRLRYGVDRLDTAIDDGALYVLQKYGIPESELKTIYESNPRLQAIVYQMLQTGENYGIQTA